jgi:MFS family permease
MGKRVLGSVVATLSGWIAGWIALVLLGGYGSDFFHHWRALSLGEALGFFAFMAIWIVPVWAVVLVPLYLFVPRKSFLWKPFVCVPLGSLAGYLVMQTWFAIEDYSSRHPIDLYVWLSIPAAIVGGITCLVGTQTYCRFNPDSCRNGPPR